MLDLIDQDQEKSIARRYYGNSSLISQAKILYRNAVEREKIDAERKPGYQDRDQERMINRIKRLSYSFDPRVDQAIFKDRLMVYKDMNSSLRRPVYSKLLKLDESEEVILNKVDEIYLTEFKNSESFLKMMEMSLDELNLSLIHI